MIKGLHSASLRFVLIVPYVALVLGLAAVIGILSYLTGSRAIVVVSEHMLLEAAGRIGQAVDRHIIGSGATLEAAFPDGMPAQPDIGTDLQNLRTRFWIATSLHIDPNNYVYYGNRSGQGIGLYRHSLQEGELRLKLRADEMRSRYRFTGINGELKFHSREEKLFDPRQRPWYKAGETSAIDTWTAVYIDFGTQELVATRARRVLSASGALEGVVATDVSLRALNDFVRNLKVSPNGLAFIIEPSGDLIASSVSDNVKQQPDGHSTRISAAESGNPLLTSVYAQMRATLARQAVPVFPQTIAFETEDGQRIHAAFDHVKDSAGLDWITVVAIPRSDITGDVTSNLIRTLGIAGLAALLAVFIGLRIINWVAGDLKNLSQVARKIGDGEFTTPTTINRNDEIGDLARSFEVMQLRLRTDRLTGLDNRESFTRKVTEKILLHDTSDDTNGFAILFIDLDDFKKINDSHGHDVGDRVLIEVAARLKAKVRGGDLVARYAGDEFVIFLDQIKDREVIAPIRAFIESALNAPVHRRSDDSDKLTVPVSGSIGVAFFPGDGDDADSLVKAADHDMYRHKASV